MTRPSTAAFTKTGASTKQWTVRWLGTGAGASVPVKTNGVSPVLTRQGVGLYTMTFQDVGGKVADLVGTTHTVATIAPQYWKYVGGSLSQSAKTIALECWSAAGALADPPATANTIVAIEVTFFDNAVD